MFYQFLAFIEVISAVNTWQIYYITATFKSDSRVKHMGHMGDENGCRSEIFITTPLRHQDMGLCHATTSQHPHRLLWKRPCGACFHVSPALDFTCSEIQSCLGQANNQVYGAPSICLYAQCDKRYSTDRWGAGPVTQQLRTGPWQEAEV